MVKEQADMQTKIKEEKEKTKACLDKKISRKNTILTLLAVFSVIVGTVTTITLYSMKSFGAEKDKRILVERKVSVLETKLEAIQTTVNDIHKTQNEFKKKLITKDDLKGVLKEAIKEGKEDDSKTGGGTN